MGGGVGHAAWKMEKVKRKGRCRLGESQSSAILSGDGCVSVADAMSYFGTPSFLFLFILYLSSFRPGVFFCGGTTGKGRKRKIKIKNKEKDSGGAPLA
jgi:hypothetical protein